MTRASIEIADFEDIAASLTPQSIAIAGASRENDVALYRDLRAKSYVSQCVLVGNKQDIHTAAKQLEMEVPDEDVFATSCQEETAERILELARSDRIDVIQKGSISTPILNRQLVKLRTRDTMSLATVFQAKCIRDGATMVMTDAGVSAILNYSRMTGLINNAAEIAQTTLGIAVPKVALLAGNEKVIQALPSTLLANDLTDAHWHNAIVYGPLSLDLAIDPGSVELKKETLPDDSPMYQVAGQADILVNPTLDAANIMYKMFMRMVDRWTARMACVTVGIKTPYVISSRSDPRRSKIDSIALACIYSNRLREKTQSQGRPFRHEVKETFNIITINPGSASTKLALYENFDCVKELEVGKARQSDLTGEALDQQVDEYVEQIRGFLGADIPKIHAVVGRGGFLNRENQRIQGGVYKVCTVDGDNVTVEEDIVSAVRDYAEMDDVSNLGIPIASRLAQELKASAFSVDPVVADELQEEARYSGYAPIERKSTGHILSIRASTRKAAEMIGRPFDRSSFVLAHISGGVSVAAVRNGKIVDNTIALLGEGPFTAQRAGTLPQNELIDLCYEGKFTREELKEELTKRAGLISYIDEDSIPAIEQRIADGDARAKTALNAMIYQIAKEIGAMTIAVGGPIDAIVLTGRLARSDRIVGSLKQRVGHFAQIIIFKGSMEMEAMAAGAMSVFQGYVEPLTYELRR